MRTSDLDDTRQVFITGGTGYLGRHLIPELIGRKFSVRALARPSSTGKLPPGCSAISGDALDERTFAHAIAPGGTFIQLVGVPHPGPGKARAFQEIDLASAKASIKAAKSANIRHFIYVSVAQPAPVMKAYQAVRAEAESMLRASGLNATVLRPWYILGPGHRWPQILRPLYWVCEQIPATRSGAQRTGLVTLTQMIASLVQAAEQPANGFRIVDVPGIRKALITQLQRS